MNISQFKISSATYRSPFFKMLEKLALLHAWVKASETRRKWAFRIGVVVIAIEIQVHYNAVSDWGNHAVWWESIPLVGKLLDLVLK